MWNLERVLSLDVMRSMWTIMEQNSTSTAIKSDQVSASTSNLTPGSR